MADETILSPNEIIEITPAMLRAGVEHLVSFDARDGCPDAEAVVRSQQHIQVRWHRVLGENVRRSRGLMSYGPDLKESMERAAGLTARIFCGALPADLPFEEPTHYQLVINLKTAKATGIELPMNFLALAKEVIE